MAPTKLFFIIFLVHLCTINTIAQPKPNPPKPKSKFPAIFIFGDSLLDTGTNNFIPTTFRATHPPYGRDFPGHKATGRFSNGLMISDLLPRALGIKQFTPPSLDPSLKPNDLKTGACFASAGAGYDDSSNAIARIIPTLRQINNFKSYAQKLERTVGKPEAQRIISQGLLLLSSGSNDFAKATNPSYVNFLIQRMQQFVKAAHGAGIRKMLLAGVPALGCFPSAARGMTACVESANRMCQMYNQRMQQALPQLQKQLPGSQLVYADFYTPIYEMAKNPQKFGLTVTNRGCCGAGFCMPLAPVCPDAKKYMFMDIVHPTEVAYRHVTDFWMKTAIPKFK